MVMAPASSKSAASWKGWLPALRKELRAAGGELPWNVLRDSLVARYYVEASVAKADQDDSHVGHCALASMPPTYLSQNDAMVRLPTIDQEVNDEEAKPSKRRRLDAGCVENTATPSSASTSSATQSLRVHVSGLPFSADEAAISKFFFRLW
jgi:hypothetical protein